MTNLRLHSNPHHHVKVYSADFGLRWLKLPRDTDHRRLITKLYERDTEYDQLFNVYAYSDPQDCVHWIHSEEVA